MWLPLVALPFMSLPVAAELSLFLAVAAVAAVLGVLGNNAWVAWMGDLVPGPLRGRFFSRRTIYITVAGTLASLSAGVALDAATPLGLKPAMLSGLAALACLAGILSVWLLLRHAAPRRVHDRKRPELRALVRAALDPRTRPWLRYLLCWNAAVALSASFFSYHMLSYLGLGFAVVALHGVAVAVVRVATAPLWGLAVDRLGARPVLVLCSFGIAAVPALWLFIAPDFLWPLAVEAAAAGRTLGRPRDRLDGPHTELGPCGPSPILRSRVRRDEWTRLRHRLGACGVCGRQASRPLGRLGTSWTAIHLLFLASAAARALAAFTALPIEERNAHSLGAVVRTIAGHALASLRLRRLPG